MPGDKFMPEMYLKQARFPYNHCGPFTKYKDLKKQEIQDIFIETNYIRLALSMIWLMVILKIYKEK